MDNSTEEGASPDTGAPTSENQIGTDPGHDAPDRPAATPQPLTEDALGQSPSVEPVLPGTTTEPAISEDQTIRALRGVRDPDLQINVIDLGLIYGIRINESKVAIDMTLTSPGCPAGAEIMEDVKQALLGIPQVTDVTVELVWAPYWSPERMNPRVRAYMGM